MVIPKAHKSIVSSLTFYPGGEKLITGSADKSIKVWNLKSNTSKLSAAIEKAHEDIITNLKLIDDAKYLYSVGGDGDVHIWDLERFEKIS